MSVVIVQGIHSCGLAQLRSNSCRLGSNGTVSIFVPISAEPLTCDIARSGGMVAFALGDTKLRLWLTAESRLAHTLALGEREIDITRISSSVIMYIHGGGWAQGNKSDEMLWLLPYLQRAGWPSM